MKKTSIKRVIAACFVGMLIVSNLIMLFINQGAIKKYFTSQVNDDMEVILDQAAMRMEAELKAVERTVENCQGIPCLQIQAYHGQTRLNSSAKGQMI